MFAKTRDVTWILILEVVGGVYMVLSIPHAPKHQVGFPLSCTHSFPVCMNSAKIPNMFSVIWMYVS